MDIPKIDKRDVEKLVVTRIRKDLRKRLSQLSIKRNSTIIALLNESVTKFLEEEEITFEDVLEFINKNPSLAIYENLLKKDFKDCPNSLCKDLLELFASEKVFVFEETKDSIAGKMESLVDSKPSRILVTLMIGDLDLNKLTNLMENIRKSFDKYKNKIKIKLAVRKTENKNEEKIILFVGHNKNEVKKEEIGDVEKKE